jgi:hypothetical protein
VKNKIIIVVLTATFFLSGWMSGIAWRRFHHPLKHTWACSIIAENGPVFWFMRPNGELFEAFFDNPPIFRVGTQLSDLAYTDDNADLRHFVKATLKLR